MDIENQTPDINKLSQYGNIATVNIALGFIAQELVVISILVALTIVTLLSITIAWVVIPEMVSYIVPDQRVHLDLAVSMFNSNSPPVAHFLYHVFVIALRNLIHDPLWLLSAVLANLITQIFTVIVIYIALRTCFQVFEQDWTKLRSWTLRGICAGLALGVLILEPLFTILTPVNGQGNQILLGYVPPTIYHNPTITILRPFAIGLNYLIIAYVLPVSKHSLKRKTSVFLVGLMIVTTVLSGLSKPNYLLALFPALSIWLGWSVLKKQPIHWRFALFGVLLPAGIMLSWQFIFTYVNPTHQLDTGGGLVFAPLKVVLQFSGFSVSIVLLRLVVSILFPASIYIVYWNTAKHDRDINFAWLTFMFGALFMYFLSETGIREYDGNFLWGAYITLFVLDVASVRFCIQMWLKQRQTISYRLDWRSTFVIILFVIHVFSGIYYIDWLNHWLYGVV